MVDFAKYAPAGTVNAFVGVPVFRGDKELYGVLAVRFSPDRINEIVTANAKKGTTGDSFIIGQDFLLRTNSRQQGAGILETKVDTRATQEGIQGKTGVGEIPGPPGNLFLNAWGPVGLRGLQDLGADFDWATVTNIGSSEAFEAVSELGRRVILIAAVIAVLVGLLAFLLARTIARPINDIAEKASRISEGNLTVEVPN